MKLKGKVAIVTGAGSGIGRATAQLFAAEGARVLVAEVNIDSGRETANSIEGAGGQATFKQVDVSAVSQLQDMVESAIQAYGKLDILFSNAGIAAASGIEAGEAEYDKGMSVNLKAAFFGAKFAAQEMKKGGGGSIIFTSSVAGLVGVTRSPIYCATKGGVSLMSKSLALALALYNVRVNAVCPGPIDTPLARQASEGGDWESAQKNMIAMVPMGRRGKPEEVARAVLFLASDDASFITGIDLPVDGGYTAH